MLRAICDACGARQPGDWIASDLCVACGQAVRSEVRCAGCTQWTPAGAFCRSCGCELIELKHYGAARMLRAAGVDGFSLKGRFTQLDPAQIDTLQRRFDAQHGIMLRRIEELQLVQTGLLDSSYVADLEEQLIPLLPLEAGELARFDQGLKGPFLGRTDLLPEIARSTPVDVPTRKLAFIAAYRLELADDLAPVIQALEGQRPIALEAALLLGHWRTRLDAATQKLPYLKMAELALPALQVRHLAGWAAVTIARAREWASVPGRESHSREQRYRALLGQVSEERIHDQLRDGLDSNDADLAFACALALSDIERLLPHKESPVEGRRTLVRRLLAARADVGVASIIADGSDELRIDALRHLPSDVLSDALAEAAMLAIERGGAAVRSWGVGCLEKQLTTELVHRILAVALREQDADLASKLVYAEPLPESDWVARQLMKTSLLEPSSWIHLWLTRPDRADAVPVILSEGDDAMRDSAIDHLPQGELPPEHVEALVQAVERGGAKIRPRGAHRAAKQASTTQVRRLVAVAVRERDTDVATAVLNIRSLPEPEWVAEQFMSGRLVEAHSWVSSGLERMAQQGALSGDSALRWLEAERDEAAIIGAVKVLQHVITRTAHVSLWRRMVVLSLTGSPKLRFEACWALTRDMKQRGLRLWQQKMQPAWDAFADDWSILTALLPVLQDRETLDEVGYHEWIQSLLEGIEPFEWPSFAADTQLTQDFLDALMSIYNDAELHKFLRSSAAALVRKMASVAAQRRRVLARVWQQQATAPLADYDLNRHFAELLADDENLCADAPDAASAKTEVTESAADEAPRRPVVRFTEYAPEDLNGTARASSDPQPSEAGN